MAKNSTQVKVTDDQILTYLSTTSKPKSITEVANKFKVTRGTARKHLNALYAENKVFVADLVKTGSVGRPAFKYAKSTAAPSASTTDF